jgi:ABC-2 type transport system ATP-binding protein
MIEVRQLTKLFGANRAVDGVSFTVQIGEILGFLGPNGAGKSTTMRMITGFLPPSSGTAIIGGADIAGAPVKARQQMGYLPENAPVYPDMEVEDFLHFCGRARGLNAPRRRARVDEAMARCFLTEVRQQTIGTLSKGFRQRVCFAQSILHDPPYLILDEPTDGLDPNQKHEVRQMIRQMAAAKAIILSTHILDEVEAVCTRAMIIAHGRVVADDTPAGLRARSPRHGTLALELAGGDGPSLVRQLNSLEGVADARLVSAAGTGLRIAVTPRSGAESIAGAVAALLQQQGCRIETLTTESGRLDDVFRAITLPDA